MIEQINVTIPPRLAIALGLGGMQLFLTAMDQRPDLKGVDPRLDADLDALRPMVDEVVGAEIAHDWTFEEISTFIRATRNLVVEGMNAVHRERGDAE